MVQSACVSAFAQFALPDTRIFGVLTTSSAAGLASAGVCFAGLLRSKSAVRFSDEVVDELVKVAWPTREETVRASTTVVLTALFTAGLLAVYDFIWKNLADLILFTEG